MTARIAIIGAGQVGAAAAYALLRGSLYGELLLVDVKPDLRDGQVRDLSDASYCEESSTRIRAGTHKEAGQCDIVVITAGSKRRRGETRLQLIGRSTATLHSIIERMRPLRSDIILLVVSSPVDVLTTLAQQLSGLPKSQVMGSGTFLDTVRLRKALANKLEIAPSPINVYVLGEHGDSQFVAWSLASIDAAPIDKALPPDTSSRTDLAEACKQEGQLIIDTKGAIAFGIGSIVSSICYSIIFDKRDIRPISYFQPDLGCCVSLPAVLGRKGIIKTIPLALSNEEKAQLVQSGKIVREAVEALMDDS